MGHIRTLTPTQARRLAITRQRLAGKRATPDARGIMDVMRDLGCLQIDPISTVARSPLLVLWSRLGAYDPAQLGALLWRERKLFEYWAHCASIVLTEDYPIHNALMRNYAVDDKPWDRRVRKWIADNDALRRAILARIRRDGPLAARALEEDGVAPRAWVSSGWTSGRNVSRMLDFLWMQGKIMVAGRAGLQKTWNLAARCLPASTPRERLSVNEVVRRAAERSLRALGVATARQISLHFIRGRYPNLARALGELETAGRIERVQIVDAGCGVAWRGEWYIHAD
ncbi:MAG: winged helix DNA-binding domain-containing protein, partial [Chloroflexota bacterium]|nr:winged helix DNA-binding domain-containing protein [Chloroflexota bacterium]